MPRKQKISYMNYAGYSSSDSTRSAAAKDTKEDAQRPSVNERLSLLRKNGKRKEEAFKEQELDIESSLLFAGRSATKTAGPQPASWRASQARKDFLALAQTLRTSTKQSDHTILELPSLRKLCCLELASRLTEFGSSSDMRSLFFLLPTHLREEILILAPTKISITDKLLRQFWVGNLPSRTLDLSGSIITVAGLRRILPRRLKAAPRRSYIDEEQTLVEAAGIVESWEQVAVEFSSENDSEEEMEQIT